ncbi:DUF6417 family protein [Streptomyces europaeiscabiei]|uniref:DUF6417 family protein n=1 Tax=Streptomyces europaeiscabiei TaxID=146819 RepID=UPI0038D4E4E1
MHCPTDRRLRAGEDREPTCPTAEGLAFLALAEAHDLLPLLLTVAQDDGPVLSQADRPAREIAARIPSEN